MSKQINEKVFQHGGALILRIIYRLQFIFLPVVRNAVHRYGTSILDFIVDKSYGM